MKKLLLLLMIVPMIGFGQTAYDYYDQGYKYENEGKHQLAIDNYTKSISIDPDYAIAYLFRGNSYVELENYKDAIADYTCK